MQSPTSKGKRHLRSPVDTMFKLLRVLSQESHKMHLITPATNSDNTYETLLSSEALRDVAQGIFI